MELTKINGNTYFLNAPTNIGIYVFNNKNCLLIDTGLNNSAAEKIDEVLVENDLHVKYIINTHAHNDHSGGNNYFLSNYPESQIYIPDAQRVFLENPDLPNAILFSSTPFKEWRTGIKPIRSGLPLSIGTNKINDENFDIISLLGHSKDHIGVITPDGVCFLGDSIYSLDILEKYSLPFFQNVEKSLDTFHQIKEINSDYFVLSHIDQVLDKDGISHLVECNLNNFENYKNQILSLLDEPLTREDILENLILLNGLKAGFRQYHLYFSVVSAFISYLYDRKLITYSLQNGRLYYYRVK